MSEFKRTLGLKAATSLVAGSVIGSGIFMKPSLMAAQVGSSFLLISVWMVAGGITLLGALSIAEVAAMFPETGGSYVYFKKMYGPAFAFLYGWSAFAVFNTAGVASIAYVFAQYAGYFLPLPQFSPATVLAIQWHIPLVGTLYPLENAGVKALTIALVLLFTLINFRSVRAGSAVQVILTVLKVAALVLLTGGVLLSGRGQWSYLAQPLPGNTGGLSMLGAYMAAIGGAFWAYDGWNNITFVGGEIKHPQRNVPRSLLLGLTLVIVVYSLVNLAYTYVMPIAAISASSFVASDAATVAWGAAGGALIAAMVMLSTMGTTNGNVLAVARVTFAMHQESRWFKAAGRVHPRFGTPGNALLINAGWTIVLVISGSFDILTDMVVFVSWFFYGMGALGIVVLRYKLPQHPRPYKVWGYPMVPLLFVLFTFFFLLVTLCNDVENYRQGRVAVINSLLGICMAGIGIPVYFLSGKKKNPSNHSRA